MQERSKERILIEVWHDHAKGTDKYIGKLNRYSSINEITLQNLIDTFDIDMDEEDDLEWSVLRPENLTLITA